MFLKRCACVLCRELKRCCVVAIEDADEGSRAPLALRHGHRVPTMPQHLVFRLSALISLLETMLWTHMDDVYLYRLHCRAASEVLYRTRFLKMVKKGGGHRSNDHVPGYSSTREDTTPATPVSSVCGARAALAGMLEVRADDPR